MKLLMILLLLLLLLLSHNRWLVLPSYRRHIVDRSHAVVDGHVDHVVDGDSDPDHVVDGEVGDVVDVVNVVNVVDVVDVFTYRCQPMLIHGALPG